MASAVRPKILITLGIKNIMPPVSALQDLLPTKWSRTIAISTFPAATAVATLPHFLSPALPSTTQAEIVLSQATLFLLMSLIGALLTLVLVLLHFQIKPTSEEKTRYARLAQHHKVMVAISRITRPSVSKIALATSMSEESVIHYIDSMRGHKYIEPQDPLTLTKEGHRAALQL